MLGEMLDGLSLERSSRFAGRAQDQPLDHISYTKRMDFRRILAAKIPICLR